MRTSQRILIRIAILMVALATFSSMAPAYYFWVFFPSNAGPYTPLMPLLTSLSAGTFLLEMATPRAGELDPLRELPGESRIGLGVVNQKLDLVEPVELIVARAERAIAIFGPERVMLNPDCGFATFADNPVASAEVAEQKLGNIVHASRALRKKYGIAG